VGASYSNGPRCLSVSLSPKLSKIDLSTVPPFCMFQDWRFAHSDRYGPVGLVNVVNGSVGTVTSRHYTWHRGGPAIVTSHSERYLVLSSSVGVRPPTTPHHTILSVFSFSVLVIFTIHIPFFDVLFYLLFVLLVFP